MKSFIVMKCKILFGVVINLEADMGQAESLSHFMKLVKSGENALSSGESPTKSGENNSPSLE